MKQSLVSCLEKANRFINDNVVLDEIPKNPSIYKIEFDDNKNVINVELVECDS